MKTAGVSETSGLSSCTERHTKDNTVAIFETVTAMLLKSCVFWDVTLCHGAIVSSRFEGSQWLHLQGPCLTLKMNTLQSFKTARSTGPVTKSHIPDDLTGRIYGYVNSDQLRALQIWSIVVGYGQYLHIYKERFCLIPYVVLSIRKSVRCCSVLTVLHIPLFRPDTCITVMLRLCPLCEVYVW
jgi:hypothetical protein